MSLSIGTQWVGVIGLIQEFPLLIDSSSLPGANSKTNNLQMAWFNGDGYESWENVWGTWNGITPYDGEAIRRVATMLRYLGKDGFLHSPEWIPHSIDVSQDQSPTPA